MKLFTDTTGTQNITAFISLALLAAFIASLVS